MLKRMALWIDHKAQITYIALTECEVCMGKVSPASSWQVTEPPRRGPYCQELKGDTFPVETKQTRLIRYLLYGSIDFKTRKNKNNVTVTFARTAIFTIRKQRNRNSHQLYTGTEVEF